MFRKPKEWPLDIPGVVEVSKEIESRTQLAGLKPSSRFSKWLPLFLAPGWVSQRLDPSVFYGQLGDLSGIEPQRKVEDYSGNVDCFSGRGKRILDITASSGYWNDFYLEFHLQLTESGLVIRGEVQERRLRRVIVKPSEQNLLAALEILRSAQEIK